MSQSDVLFTGTTRSKYLVFAATLVVAALGIGVAATLSPFIPLGIALLFAMLMVLLRRPNFIVVFVAFVIFTNTAVVMIKFHNVPAAIAYALPLLLVIPFVWQLVVKRQKIKVNFVFALMLIFFSIMLLGSAFSRDIRLATPGLLNFAVEGLALYFLLINTIRTTKLLDQIVWSLLIGGALIGGLALYQQITGTFDNNYWGYAQAPGAGFTTAETIQGSITQPRVSGPIGEKNRFAQVMLMVVPLGLFQIWGEKNKNLRLIAFLCTSLILIGGSLAFSRGAQVGLLLLIIIMTFMRYIKFQQLAIMLAGIALILIAFPQNTQRFLSLRAIFSSQEEGGLRNADGAIQGRATEMLAALLVFRDHPLVGVGPGMFGYEMAEYSRIISLRNILTTRQAHSLYFGVAAEEGALGLLTLLGILIYTLYRLAKARMYWQERGNTKLANLSTGFFLAVIGYMTTGMFLHFAYIRYFWLLIALSIIASEFREQDIQAETELEGKQLEPFPA